MRRACSAASSSVVAAPSPPVPPISSTCRSRKDSSNSRLLRLLLYSLGRDVPAAGDYQEHGQHFTVAQVKLEQAGDHGGQNDGGGAMQDEAAIARPGRKSSQRLLEIDEHEQQHPDQDQHGGDAALGGVMQINVV